MLNPIMPFISEELHAHLYDKKPDDTTKEDWLMTASWPEFEDGVIDQGAIDEMDWVIRLIEQYVRADMNVPPAAYPHGAARCV